MAKEPTEDHLRARIYRPAKTAMQSGRFNTRRWVLEFEPSERRRNEPLMGWISSGDTRRQLKMYFETRDDALAYAKKHGIAARVMETRERPVIQKAYADNFKYQPPRDTGWSLSDIAPREVKARPKPSRP